MVNGVCYTFLWITIPYNKLNLTENRKNRKRHMI